MVSERKIGIKQGNRKQETGNRKQETGDRRQGTGKIPIQRQVISRVDIKVF